MQNHLAETIREEEYLAETLEAAKRQIAQAQVSMDRKKQELIEAKKDLRENTEHGITSFSSTGGFEALVELSQSMTPVTEIAVDCEETAKKIRRLETLLKSPYFARIDFRFEGEDEPEKIYIGRTSLTENASADMYVYDWRSPIASVFYRFLTGDAFYDAPAGRITGRVEQKRQYEIKNSRLVYFFDTDRNVHDEILRQLLSRNTTPKMKAIVETIQRDQDVVIRNMDSDLLMIQGVAGSGKTSIALHRAAYLMYQDLQSKLSANHILILSPNTAFERYIEDVLPELGEENVVSMVFEELLPFYLKEKPIQTQSEFLEMAVGGSPEAELVKRSMKFKTSELFVKILNRFAADIPRYEMVFQDIFWEGRCIAEKEDLRKWLLCREDVPLGIRLEQLEDRILEKLDESGEKLGRGEKNLVLQDLQRFTRLNLYQLYKSLWDQDIYFKDMDCKGEFAESIQEIKACTRKNLKAEQIWFDDGTAMLYLYLKIYGSREYQSIRQVIIDEAQDYYPLQYEIFRMLFFNAKYTVLGDVNQTLAKQEDLSFYERVKGILNKRSVSYIELNKSFRCTNEILQFSLQFINQRPELESFNRKGEAVKVMTLNSHKAYLDQIVQEVEDGRQKGFESIGLICKTKETCEGLFSELQSRIKLKMMEQDGGEHLTGNFLIPSYMAKGLEFDAVIICDADSRHYSSEDDRKILYVECTRALHKLSLFGEEAD